MCMYVCVCVCVCVCVYCTYFAFLYFMKYKPEV